MSIARTSFVTLLGPSGCGKTTLLKVIAGLHKGHGGHVRLSGRDVTRLPPYRRNIGVVFQNYALFPHLSVFENIAFGVRLRPDLAGRMHELVEEALDLVRLRPFAGRAVTSLSGGQQQRVAVARSLVVGPSILLLDEPFSALDRQLREEMQIELRQILRQRRMTPVFVTHDQEEAVIMSDRIVVMRQGAVKQEAPPEGLYENPNSVFVLDFVGKSTKLAGTVVGPTIAGTLVQTALGCVTIRTPLPQGSAVWVGVRADRILSGAPGPLPQGAIGSSVNRLPSVRVRDMISSGATRLLIAEGGEQDRVNAQILGTRGRSFAPGETCALEWKIDDTLVFPLEREV